MRQSRQLKFRLYNPSGSDLHSGNSISELLFESLKEKKRRQYQCLFHSVNVRIKCHDFSMTVARAIVDIQ